MQISRVKPCNQREGAGREPGGSREGAGREPGGSREGAGREPGEREGGNPSQAGYPASQYIKMGCVGTLLHCINHVQPVKRGLGQ